ncbi:hypothetical protein MTX35_20015 [Rhodococcus sp. ARC_M12]|uniref:hypothetical protein n=1 Tax=Rhodococcus sp. ARC_M12 TaxID=2928854 RepID=UPI001FB3EFDD|nr:hypothetical protein [Rhodococcus sp. ARC_M12]MCJ0980000.1 hypothetical protein [Rhodococcus sp. ARC_M12]
MTWASAVTSTLIYALLGRTGYPLSVLLLLIPLVPFYAWVMRKEKLLQAGPDWDRQKDKFLAIVIFPVVAVAVVLALLVPVPVLTDVLPLGGAFGVTVASAVVIVIAIIARGQWRSRRGQ